jgi:hypothetical protein
MLMYPHDAKMLSTPGMCSIVVDKDHNLAAFKLARKRAIKTCKHHNTCNLKGMKGTMKWPSFLSTFVLNKICDIIMSGVRNKKGFKEVHLNNVTKKVFEFYGS